MDFHCHKNVVTPMRRIKNEGGGRLTFCNYIFFTNKFPVKGKGKGKGVPPHAMEAHGGRGGIAPTHT
jgi:hypothetical protein